MVSDTIDLQQITNQMGGPRKIKEDFRRFSNSMKRLHDERTELTAQYPDQWIAIYDGEIQAVAVSFQALLQVMDEREIPRGESVVELMSTNPTVLIL